MTEQPICESRTSAESRQMSEELFGTFLSYRRALVDAAARILGCRAGAEDVVQDTFVKLLDQDGGIAVRQPVGFLFQTVRNLAIDRHRRAALEQRHAAAEEEGLLVSSEAMSPEALTVGREALDAVSSALAELPERTQRAFELYRLHGLTQKEIAAMLGVSPTLVNFMIRDAMTHCRDALFGTGSTPS